MKKLVHAFIFFLTWQTRHTFKLHLCVAVSSSLKLLRNKYFSNNNKKAKKRENLHNKKRRRITLTHVSSIVDLICSVNACSLWHSIGASRCKIFGTFSNFCNWLFLFYFELTRISFLKSYKTECHHRLTIPNFYPCWCGIYFTYLHTLNLFRMNSKVGGKTTNNEILGTFFLSDILFPTGNLHSQQHSKNIFL